jgi:hypothetical protein
MRAPLLLLALAALSTAQAAEPERLTLACQGEKQMRSSLVPGGPLEEQVSMGVIVDFTAGTVTGFGDEWPWPIPIRNLTSTAVPFRDDRPGPAGRIIGAIDRITGATEASIRSEKLDIMYSLKCKPAQRMF